MANKQEKTRYSDEELQEFKELILAKIDQAQENYKRLKDNIMVDESDPTFKMMEEGASTLQKEMASQQAERQLDFIRKLQAAHREQDLRRVPHHGQTHPQGAPDGRSARHVVDRG